MLQRNYERYRGWEIDNLGLVQGYLARRFVHGNVEGYERDTSLKRLLDTIDAIENDREE